MDNRLRKLQAEPDQLSYYDDLAVAFDKTGQFDRAIEIIRAKDGKRPGLYETEANLGTFLLHAGRWEEALGHINQAVRINPDAHFGREKYQALLVEHALARRGTGVRPEQSFGAFLATKWDGPAEDERQAAIKGVLGMMKFSKHDSPVLLEALASLLGDDALAPSWHDRQLAARAYLKLSYAASGAERARFRARAGSVLSADSLDVIEQMFREELTEAEAWYANVRANELAWIRAGKNPEEAFNNLYYMIHSPADRARRVWDRIVNTMGLAAGGFLVLLLLRNLLRAAFGFSG